MASFNISKGLEASLPSTKTDGKMYFCTDTGNIYIDYKDGNNILRKLVNKQILDAKQDAITGAASTITNSNLTANRVLLSNSSGKVAASAITSTELSYLDGVTSNIQTQLDGKLAKTAGYAGSSSAGGSATSAVKLDSSAGSATQPVYFSGGKPVKTTYTLGKSVPSDAKFTDTTYSAAGSALGLVKSGGDVTISSGVITVKDDSHNHVISNIDELQTALDNKQNKYGNRHIITVKGEANKYYPVLITNLGQESYAWSHLHISRGYSWPAPDTWNTSTHRGGLTLSLRWSGDTGWGGNDKTIEVEEFAENYTTMVGGLTLSVSGLVVWLRGGTAQYAFQADYGNSINITVNLGTYTAADGKTYAVKTTPDTAGVKAFWYNRHGTYVGNASSATKLTSSAGSATQPVYFSGGKPVATTYTLGKSVPSNAKFTDTTYSNFVKSGSGAKAGLVPAPSTTAGTTKYLREDGTWAVPPDTNTTYTFNGAVSTIKDSNLTASRALISNSSGKVAVSAVTSTELGYLDGVTSAIQTQLNGKLSTSGGSLSGAITINKTAANKTNPTSQDLVLNYSLPSGGTLTEKNAPGIGFHIGNVNWASLIYDGTFKFVNNNFTGYAPVKASSFTGALKGNADTATKLATARTIRTNLASTSTASFDGSGNITPGVTGTLPIANGGTGATTAAGALTNLGITATAAELNKMDGVTASTTEINKLKGLTATTKELNYVDGVTSAIQTQLNNKAPKYQYSTTDLTAGSSSLTTGTLYFVYE